MKLNSSVLLLVSLLIPGAVFAGAPDAGGAVPASDAAAAVKVLKQRFPKFDWQPKTAISVDIDADGLEDVAVLGYTQDTAAVGVVFGRKSGGETLAKYMDFMRCDDSSQRAMNGCTGTLKASKQDAGIQEELGQLPEGYKVCDRCYEIQVVGDEDTDPIFVYWDAVAKNLNWWRY